jgi:hypothetical protein
MTIEQLIHDHLDNNPDWIFGGTIERELSSPHKPGTINRALRRMAEKGDIQCKKVKYANKYVVQYKTRLQAKNNPHSYQSAYELATML